MNWDQLLSATRTGQEDRLMEKSDRTQFQRDYDRLIFSSPFRRMQDKTQVFPLPGSIFVHNRLTHSLEVSCVGRSLGHIVSRYLEDSGTVRTDLVHELGSVVAAACLAHDMGNPPFGHSGEKAISHFFSDGPGKRFQADVTEKEWTDLTHFEGNANALRILTHKFNGRRTGGFALTYTTLASIVKYPFTSADMVKNKYGFFQTETETYRAIAQKLGIPEKKPSVFARHPLVYLVEAADDICYLFMDIEDAHKLGIIQTREAKELLKAFFDLNETSAIDQRIKDVEAEVTDVNEQLAFLRAMAIGKLVEAVGKIFIDNHQPILAGEFEKALVDHLPGQMGKALDNCKSFSYERIYRHPKVAEIEIAGFKILGSLLEEFTNAVTLPENNYSKLMLPFIPAQFSPGANDTVYLKIQNVVDFISGMTDVYALELSRKINGIGLKSKSF
ncbi:MAG: deoxyguanosinetriphosphate triphosphohydrolase [Breznakibacter sp.]